MGLLSWPPTSSFCPQSSVGIVYPCLPLAWLVGPTRSLAYGGSARCCSVKEEEAACVEHQNKYLSKARTICDRYNAYFLVRLTLSRSGCVVLLFLIGAYLTPSLHKSNQPCNLL